MTAAVDAKIRALRGHQIPRTPTNSRRRTRRAPPTSPRIPPARVRPDEPVPAQGPVRGRKHRLGVPPRTIEMTARPYTRLAVDEVREARDGGH
jgi:hypothetical protein